MVVMLCRNRVADFAKWKAVFASHASAHREAGLRLMNLWRGLEDPNNVFFLFEVTSLDKARAFISNPAAACWHYCPPREETPSSTITQQ